MNKTDLVLMALVRCVLAEGADQQNKAKKELQKVAFGYEEIRRDPEVITMELLMEIGAQEHQIGYQYVVKAVLWILEDVTLLNHMMSGIYAKLADEYGITPSAAESRIRHVVEQIWEKGDLDLLNRYFRNTVDRDKGKPTNGLFLARLTNIVRMELRK